MDIDPKVLEKAKKHKTAAPIPDPELRARPRGGLQWSCPDCGNLHSQDKQFWKRAMIRCGRIGCQHKFRIGVGLTPYEGSYRCLFMGPWQYGLANRLYTKTPNILPFQPVGRLFGLLDWQCPDCNKIQVTTVDFFDGIVRCCKTWFIQLLIYKPSGSRNITPYDWAIYVPETYKPLSPETSSTIQ